ncbi:Inner membrane protein ydjM [Chlamydia trachomatis]|nr:Inner membrane protein ydjM [Chlamydia trachomatis]
MEGKTHIAGGIAAGAFYLTFGGSMEHEALFIGSCALGSILPDICHPNSMIGRRVPLLDNLISEVFGHRTITHSLLILILTLFFFGWTTWPLGLEYGIFIGMVSHLVLDAFTKQGIQFFWPFKVKVGFPFGITTGGMLEKAFMAMLITFIGYYGYTTYL